MYRVGWTMTDGEPIVTEIGSGARSSVQPTEVLPPVPPKNGWKQCKLCGSSFWCKYPSQLRQQKFCSKACYLGRYASMPKELRFPVRREKLCPECGKSFLPPDMRKIFCSDACFHQWQSRDRSKLPTRTCDGCRKHFRKTRRVSNRGNYCSRRCWVSHGQKGKFVEHRIQVCRVCGKQYDVTPGTDHPYCSRKCYNSDPAQLAIRGERLRLAHLRDPDRLRILRLELKMPRENTIPEQLCQKMLDELHIAYLDHKRVGSVCQPDFIIPRRKIAIFVDGDFWHCNPEVYPDGPMCETQRRVTTKDRRQESRLRELGWQILRLWEKDLKTHPEMCKGRIWSVIGAES